MPHFTDHELTEIKSIPLVDLLRAEGLVLKKQGKDYVTQCVFHDDKTASLSISPNKNLFHCFGCGEGGSVIDWVMKRQNVSFRYAVEWLKDYQSGVGVSSFAAKGRANPNSKPTRLANPVSVSADDAKVLHEVIDYYHRTLKSEPKVHEYLAKRGLDDAVLIDHFRLGFANRSLGLRLPLKNRVAGGQVRTQLQQIGLYRANGREHFNGSLIVPVYNARGQVVNVYGRKITSALREGTPKHLYLPGKHQGVFNLNGFTGKHYTGEVILCEALIDALTCWRYGLHQVTSSFGTQGFTDEIKQALVDNGISRVFIAYDNDEAGNTAADKVSSQLAPYDIDTYRLHLPVNDDVNSYACALANPQAALHKLVKTAKPMRVADKAVSSLVADVAGSVAMTGFEPATPNTSITPSPVNPHLPCPEVSVELSDNEQHLTIANRVYRVRGLLSNDGLDTLRVQILVRFVQDEQALAEVINPEALHTDKLDLYSSKQRQVFINQAHLELGVASEVIKSDLGKLILTLEAIQQQRQTSDDTQSEVVTLTSQERAEALVLLQDPKLLERILSDFALAGVVGEDSNKLVGYVACVSRLLPKPLAVMIQSSSAAGKSSLMDAVLNLVPPEQRIQYSAMTGQSLFYMGETNLQHKILAISEEEGAHHASYALKLLQSEGEVSIASTGKDDSTGNLVTKEYTVRGPVMLMMTTTAIDIDEELMNRCMVLSVNESREQTQAIHHAQRSKRTLAGLKARLQTDTVINLHQNAQRLLKPLAVINPYADQLTFLDDKTRTRRDHDKYLTLIDSIALLHQYQREVKTLEHGGQQLDYIEVTLKDIEVANRLASEVLGKTLDELPPQTRKLLNHITEQVTHEVAQLGIKPALFRFNRRWVREGIGWSEKQVRVHMQRLLDMEYVLAHRGGRGQRFEYELLYEGQGTDGTAFVMGLLDINKLDTTKLKAYTTTPTSTTQTDNHYPTSSGVRLDLGTVKKSPQAKQVKASSTTSSTATKNKIQVA